MTALLAAAVGSRHGIVPPPQAVPTTRCDVPGVHHASVASPHSPAGGVGWTEQHAADAAVAEALERYAAAVADLEAVTVPPGEPWIAPDALFPFTAEQLRRGAPAIGFAPEDPGWCSMASLADGRRVWVPRVAVGLGVATEHSLVTSSGLAAAPSLRTAQQRALAEVIERDALMVAWLHDLAAPVVPLADSHREAVAELGGTVRALDLSPQWSPWPVAAVCGTLPRRGVDRAALGSACAPTWERAVERAYLEWCQATLFARVQLEREPARRFRRPTDVRTFEDHAVHHTMHPERWSTLRFPLGGVAAAAPERAGCEDPVDAAEALASVGIEPLWRDLTTPDLAQIGLRVVRVVCPGLTPIHADERWPFLGSRAADATWRFPWAASAPSRFPNRQPHPLG